MRAELAQFFESRYDAVKTSTPSAGRRQWHLLLLEQFWSSSPPPSQTARSVDENLVVRLTQDEDRFDSILSDVEGGVIIRTDFSDEEAWKTFCGKLNRAEEEFRGSDGGHKQLNTDAEGAGDDMEMDDDESDDSNEGGSEGLLVKVINPELPEERTLFENISNLTALRLLNDVDIRPAPPLPSDTKCVSTPHRLVDHLGWQEVYSGVNIWIYDAKSNSDRSVRLVSQESDIYGTATGDSWRAQVSHIYDLQFNITFTGLKINFGGMDRWDYSERKRNLDEALTSIT
ncbi:hypothetical protein Moror_16345 [Moniliophthora roreri MCA 2997]|uniref:Uncharacterized protein n=2 Tax=Moniliophthora roreri TaxID=221103 RepID=V2XEV5_MONRO|nr:hypothetical protein Moror_16345 [Moniliophthora roreri MCA 2997]KAI3596976.1 hypothetical protein WG66_006393 [Moniliophthora roreri]